MNAGIRVRDDLPEEIRKFRRDAYPSLTRIFNVFHLKVRFRQDAMVVEKKNEKGLVEKFELKSLEEINRFEDSLKKNDSV
jgi:hypothetical protein